MTTPVVWLSYRDDVRPERQWDSGLFQRIVDQTLWKVPGGQDFESYYSFNDLPEGTDGCVVVLPGQHHTDFAVQLNQDLARFTWVVLILIGDECSIFPFYQIKHRNMRLWIMTPRPQLHGDVIARFFGEGWKYETPDTIARFPIEKFTTWFFAGQITHPRREQMVDALRAVRYQGELIETPGFTQGLPRDDYLRRMADSWIVPCPSGPGTPDSFRLYEALEAGCLPIADAVTPDGWTGYWKFVYGDVPFPIIEDWSTIEQVMIDVLPDIVGRSNRASAWWQQHKRDMAYALDSDVRALSGVQPRRAPSDQITVLIPTSPTPSNPSTDLIEETVASIRAQADLANAEIIIMVDGVRPEQDKRRDAYDLYTYNLLRLTERWHNVIPVLAPEWLHQANLTKLGLALTRTPYVLFVEHDTPLVHPAEGGTIPWGDLCDLFASRDDINVLRFHHEANVLDPHQHLMLDHEPRVIERVPLLRCAQWSQRPHLARTDFYRNMLKTYFGSNARTMIEDSIHGVLSELWLLRGDEGWAQFGVWMYAPDGSMKRSYHTDGRANDPKFDMQFEYDGAIPEGAPYPTSRRVD